MKAKEMLKYVKEDLTPKARRLNPKFEGTLAFHNF